MTKIGDGLKRFFGSKTTWTALATIAAAGSAYADHQMSLAQLIQTTGWALIAAFLRDAIAKGPTP